MIAAAAHRKVFDAALVRCVSPPALENHAISVLNGGEDGWWVYVCRVLFSNNIFALLNAVGIKEKYDSDFFLTLPPYPPPYPPPIDRAQISFNDYAGLY